MPLSKSAAPLAQPDLLGALDSMIPETPSEPFQPLPPFKPTADPHPYALSEFSQLQPTQPSPETSEDPDLLPSDSQESSIQRATDPDTKDVKMTPANQQLNAPAASTRLSTMAIATQEIQPDYGHDDPEGGQVIKCNHKSM